MLEGTSTTRGFDDSRRPMSLASRTSSLTFTVSVSFSIHSESSSSSCESPKTPSAASPSRSSTSGPKYHLDVSARGWHASVVSPHWTHSSPRLT